jgi:epoxyqueuosine reductase
MSIEAAIKDRARALGFDLAGITTPDPPPHLAFYAGWLQAGHHGEMGWLATERARARRADPRQILPECRSIVAVGVNYYWPAPAAPHPAGAAGRVARYAWGKDYHEVIPARLRELAAFIEAEAGRPVRHKIYTDTGPLLERDLAQRAGLGWIGKNTNLIHPGLGSWLLLGELLLDLALTPDAAFEADRCGTCTLCIEACPTGAILDGRLLDARRCISYHTIELKGEIPAEYHPAIGDWLFGCDICQEVCPWNARFAEAGAQAAPPVGARADLAPRPGQSALALDEVEALTPEAFKQRFGDTPLSRTKAGGLRRNAQVVRGNAS